MGDERSEQHEQAGEPRIDSVHLKDIGQRLMDLGQLLIETGKYADSEKLRRLERQALELAIEEVYEDLNREAVASIRRTLTSLNTFRREYSDWERLTVEYALKRGQLTQRDVASLLGVGLSTVNRWAQHPLTYED